MSLQDPIADMLTAIRNACMVNKPATTVPASRVKEQILSVLVSEGYIQSFERVSTEGRNNLVILLKYLEDEQPVIQGLERISRPGLRRYSKGNEIPKVRSGLGHMILTTSEGVMTDATARRKNIGGELILRIW